MRVTTLAPADQLHAVVRDARATTESVRDDLQRKLLRRSSSERSASPCARSVSWTAQTRKGGLAHQR